MVKMMESKEKLISTSKFLSYVLRHRPEKIGITLDEQGWVSIEELIEKSKISMPLLEEVVATNDKKRYEFNSDKSKIRACQGHSINIDLSLSPKKPPTWLYHGTQRHLLDSIIAKGLIRGKRNHVHLSIDKETAFKVGSRHGRDTIILTIMAEEMSQDGHKFYLSSNEVWLTDDVPPEYIKEK